METTITLKDLLKRWKEEVHVESFYGDLISKVR